MKIDYWKNGWGLHEIVLNKIKDIIINNDIKNIVEFGSGGSTEFLINLRKEMGLTYKITSFDHNQEFCFKGEVDDYLKLNIRDIESCSDEDFNQMFVDKQIYRNNFFNNQKEKNNFRVKNTFYGIEPGDIPENVDLVILDGPSGNGRSLAFLHLKEKLSKNYFIIIDDSDHYDFIQRCKDVNDCEVILHEHHPEIHRNFNFAILKNK